MEKPFRYHVFPCSGPRCTPEMGEASKARLKDLLPDRKALGVRVSTSSCQGMCARGPNITVYPEGIVYHQVTLSDVDRIVDEHLRGGVPVREILERTHCEGEATTSDSDGDNPAASPPEPPDKPLI